MYEVVEVSKHSTGSYPSHPQEKKEAKKKKHRKSDLGVSQYCPGSSSSSFGAMEKESSLINGKAHYRVSYHEALQSIQLLSPAADKGERFMWGLLVCCLVYPPFCSALAFHLFLFSDETDGYNYLQAKQN